MKIWVRIYEIRCDNKTLDKGDTVRNGGKMCRLLEVNNFMSSIAVASWTLM